MRGRRWLRNTSGFALLFAGLIGPITPVFGVWMLPLGLVLLSVDFPWADRLHGRLREWVHRGRGRLSPVLLRRRGPKP